MEFARHGSRQVLAAFDGAEMTSDAGILLLRESDRQLNLSRRIASCFEDHRTPGRIKHPLSDLVAQRITAMALGYEDLNDHDTPPERITLDIDATDIQTHGHQGGSFFHGYYEHKCFLPLYIFCGPHLLLAQLRPGNIDAARGARNVIKRIVSHIRHRWPKVQILLRGDSGFVREKLMKWCEWHNVDFIFGLAKNDYLLDKAQKVRRRAAEETSRTSKPVEMFGHFTHRPRTKSWDKPRHVTCKVSHKTGPGNVSDFWSHLWIGIATGSSLRSRTEGLMRVTTFPVFCTKIFTVREGTWRTESRTVSWTCSGNAPAPIAIGPTN